MFSFLARLNTPNGSPGSSSRSSSPRLGASPGWSAAFASDPTQWESTFGKCWQSAERILENKESNPEHVISYDEMSHLLAQLTQMNQLLMMEVNSQPEPVIGPILDRYFTQQIMERIMDWAIQVPDFNKSICQLSLIRLYEAIVGESHTQNHCLLVHKPILNPLLRLFQWCKRADGPRPSITGEPSVHDKHFVLLLNQICTKLAEDRTLLHFFFSCCGGGDQFAVFTLLVPFLYEQNDVGQLARDAVLLILSVSAQHDAIGDFVANKSAFCPVVATGLSGCFSQLPRILAPEGSDRLVPEHSLDVLANFNSSLVFCNAVAQAAHPSVVSKICSFFYSGFLISVVKPALLQEEKEAVAASTEYLQMCFSALTEPSLVRTVIRMLLIENDDKDVPLIITIVERISGNDRVASSSLHLLDSVLQLSCEDVMLVLVLRNLLSLRFSRQQLSRIYDSSYTQTVAQKLLDCVPECMLKVSEMCSSNTVENYITEGAELVERMTKGCSAWKWRYDGVRPNPSVFRADSDEEIGLTTLSRLSSCRSSMTSGRGLNSYFAAGGSHLTAESTADPLVDLGGFQPSGFVDNFDEGIIEEDDEFVLPPVSMTSMVDYFQLAAFDDLSEGDEYSGSDTKKIYEPVVHLCEPTVDTDAEMARSFVLSGWSDIEDMDTFLSLLDRQPLSINADKSSVEECVNYIDSRIQYWKEFNTVPELGENTEDKLAEEEITVQAVFGLPIESSADSSPFLDIILSQLESFYDHSLVYNLHFTSLLTNLAAYPLPLLVFYLFDDGRKGDGKVHLLEILSVLKQRIDELTANIDGLDVWIGRALRTLHTRSERAERIGDVPRPSDSPKEESSPISSFIRNRNFGASGRRSGGIRYHIHKAIETAETARDDERIKNIVHSAIVLANLVQYLAGIILQQSVAVVRQQPL